MDHSAETETDTTPSPFVPPTPACGRGDLGAMIGLIPRTLPGCLGWHLAVQPGPAPHGPVAHLPPMLWSTSTLCPVLVLPPSSATVERGGPVRRPPAIRQPSLPAWEQAVVLIVQRSRQALRHRRNRAPPRSAVPRSAAARPGLALPGAAGIAHGKDPMRRENHPPPRSTPSAGAPPSIADVFAAPAACRAATCVEDPTRREIAATATPEPVSSVSLPSARTTPAATAAAMPARTEHPKRRDSNAPSSPSAIPAEASGHAASPNPPAAPPTASHAQDPIRREPPPPRTGPLRNGNPRGNPNLAPRCGARTRLGCSCRGPAMRNGRCRMHGGASTGPRTPEGLARLRAARTLHGGRAAAEARAFIRTCRAQLRVAHALIRLANARAAARGSRDPAMVLRRLTPPPLPAQPQVGSGTLYAVRTPRPAALAPAGHHPPAGPPPQPPNLSLPEQAARQHPLHREAAHIAQPALAPQASPRSAPERRARPASTQATQRH